MKTFNSVLISTLLLISFQSESLAHTKSVSYSTWNIQEDEVIVNFTVSSREITKLREYQINYPNLNESLESHLIQQIYSDQIISEPLINVLNTEIGTTGLSLRFYTNQVEKYIFDMNIFFDQIPGHIHYARINHHMGQVRTLVLNQTNHEIVFFSELNETEEQEWFDSFKQYIGLGFTHILEGIDHLLFLLALLILCKSFKSLVFAATGFTIGHSLTLGLAASNIVIPQVDIIESLIGWTIILASIESINLPRHELRKIQSGVLLIIITLSVLSAFNINELKIGFILGLGLLTLAILKLGEDPEQSEKLRPMLAIIFGTIHGFGFANILSEISLDRTNFLVSLLGFNIGVEIGQILVLVIMWALMSFLVTKILISNIKKITELVSSILCSIGLYWFLTRLLG
tara:strand:- start:661 stop:1866 length:1206 start_codon:yes stop_codon:yes gene_type:complete